MSAHTDDAAAAHRRPVEVHWLLRLRWAAIVAQIASVLGVRYLMHAPFPDAPLVAIIGLLAAANVALGRWLARGHSLSDGAITANLLLDIAALTGLLVYTGGAMNPFTTLYLLHVALAAVLVPRRSSLVVAVAAVIAFGALLLARPEAIHVWHSGGMFLLHVRGMWLAFALTAGCLWLFVDRVTTALRRREAELSAARVEAMRAERLAALGTLAAGTAHELNTPLGTVAILAGELSELLAQAPEARAHADKIRGEVRRCTEILTKMRSHEGTPEPREPVALVPWLRDAVAEWCARHPGTDVPVRVAPAAAASVVALRAGALRAAVHNLLDNARSATEGVSVAPRGALIEVTVEPAGAGFVAVSVVDRGVGIPPALLARVGQPFFTTREPGAGMGLGVFLVEAALAQHGGRLAVRSRPGETHVQMTLPTTARVNVAT